MSHFNAMQISDSREQQLFLVTGGIILTLILGVVIVNMVKQNGEEPLMTDLPSDRPVVSFAASERQKDGQESWIDAMAPAPVFTSFSKPAVDPDGAGPDGAGPDGAGEEAVPPREVAAGISTVQSEAGKSADEGNPWRSWSPDAGRVESNRQAQQHASDDVSAAHRVPLVAMPFTASVSDAADAVPEGVGRPVGRPVNHQSKQPSAAFQAVRDGSSPGGAALVHRMTPMLQLSPVPSRDSFSHRGSLTSSRLLPSHRLATATNPSPPVAASGSRAMAYQVRLASFSNESNAMRLKKKLALMPFGEGVLPVVKDDIRVGKILYYRVQMGPFVDRRQAERAVQLVERAVNIRGVIVEVDRP